MYNALESLDRQVRRAVVSALMLGPTKLFPLLEAEAPEHYEDVQNDLIDLYSSQLISQAELVTQLASLQPGELLMPARRLTLFEGGVADLETAVEVRRELGERYDALSFQQRQRLASELLEIHVSGNDEATRFEIIHRVATSLNI